METHIEHFWLSDEHGTQKKKKIGKRIHIKIVFRFSISVAFQTLLSEKVLDKFSNYLKDFFKSRILKGKN